MDCDKAKDNENEKKNGCLTELFQWAQAILIAALVALVIRGFLFEPVEVIGESMENTLQTNQRLILYKLGYYFNPPKQGDIVVLQVQEGVLNFIPFAEKIPFIKKLYSFPEEIDYIKRVIGVPGDIIDIKDGFVYVNGIMLEESYAKGKTYANSKSYPKVVPADNFFVLGDNRENSSDSRHIGFIEYNRIKGKAVFCFWPLNEFGTVD